MSSQQTSPHRSFSLSPLWTALLLFVVALIPRLPGLGRFLTSDENTNIFYAGSDVIAAFLNGNLRGTYWHFYPGVTMSWLDALGMGGQYTLDLVRGASPPPFAQYIYGDILSLVVANRLPYAILSAVAVALIYWLSRKLLPTKMALLGALFLAFDPFYLAHSRVAHGDAPVAVFMTISALSFFVYLQNGQRTPGSIKKTFFNPWLIISAICGGLAALTKAPGQFMAFFIVGVSALYVARELQTANRKSKVLFHWFMVILAWGVYSLAIFILLWPSMWVDPVGTIQQMLDETFGKVNEGHLVYFFGQPGLDPGPWFYPYVIPFRLTPTVSIGAVLSLLLFVPKFRNLSKPTQQTHLTLLLLWLFTISLMLFGNLSPKKQDRYLLPLFPTLNLIAAIGWVNVISLGLNSLQSEIVNRKSQIVNLAIVLLVFIHALPILTYYPYYLAYFNPLMGGPTRAAETTLMGWGEGMEQVANYLNTKPNAAEIYVASTPSQTLLPYFAGTGENFYTNDIAFRADYVVLYLAQIQRLAPSPEIVRYFLAQQPEETITIQNVDYAKIYPGPKLILSDIPADAIPANIGIENVMRLAGYKLNSDQPEITLVWHALTPIDTNYTISVRAIAIDDTLLAQQDQQPITGLLPTSLWRQGDYVIDTHTLPLSSDDTSQISQYEVVVYNADTGQTLGPPVTINNEQ